MLFKKDGGGKYLTKLHHKLNLYGHNSNRWLLLKNRKYVNLNKAK
jgi:hypothetical protein